ncbi:uncharacterized protein LOC100376466 [Saccoglossus kowalevskii]|uniref:Uncharacterized protein LOC100376466 n=1 Tax=Saccoglossus kowalevskii TaxID=10224 RepID=A0ABM0GN13_SACKO|nr:PREDICTED: uncharacterized protein LOC100376466 [Saccoglossus kowalevskii]
MKLILLTVTLLVCTATASVNVAYEKPVFGIKKGGSESIVDDNDDTCGSIGADKKKPFIKIDLGSEVHVNKIRLTLDESKKRKFDNSVVRVGVHSTAEDNPVCFRIDDKNAPVNIEHDNLDCYGRYIVIQKMGKSKRSLHVCELRAWTDDEEDTDYELVDVAAGETVYAAGEGDSSNIVDGDVSTCHASGNRKDPYMKIDLGRSHELRRIELTLNKDRIRAFHNSVVRVGSEHAIKDNPVCFRIDQDNAPVNIAKAVVCTGRYLIVQKLGKGRAMNVCEIKAFIRKQAHIEPTVEPTEPEVTAAPITVAPTVPVAPTDANDVTTIPPTMACTNPEGLRNIAVGKAASQSSTNPKVDGIASLAVDGIKDTDLRSGKSCTQTNKEFQPWWSLDLGSSQDVYQVIITNRQDCCSFRLKNAVVRVGDSPNPADNPVCGLQVLGKRSRQEQVIMNCGCGDSMTGRYVSIQLMDKTQIMHLCEVEVMTL